MGFFLIGWLGLGCEGEATIPCPEPSPAPTVPKPPPVDPSDFCGPGTVFDEGLELCIAQPVEPELPVFRADFDAGTERWEIVDLASGGVDYGTPRARREATWFDTGGADGGGYISHLDNTSDAFFFSAPCGFLGDKSAFSGGRLSFELRSDVADFLVDAFVVLEGNGGVTVVAPVQAPQPNWTAIDVALDVSVEWRLDDGTGPLVTQPELDAVLANLEALRIPGEWGLAVTETVGLDRVELVRPSTP